MRPELSLVIPIYNEEAILPTLDTRLKGMLGRLGLDAEVIFVDDGSRDRSLAILRGLAERDARYRVVAFSRNFGHQRAISAGMDKSHGKAVVVMDADLQDPPEVVVEMVAKWREGFDVVYGRRRSRAGESAFKLGTAALFYRLFRVLIPIDVPLDTGDFRLMSRRVVNTMRGLRESHRFVRGLVSWVGFKQTAVDYDRSARVAGETKYPLGKMLAFAIDGIASFSIQPLRFASYVGALVGAASVFIGVAAIASHLVGVTVPGWTTMVVLVAFLFSVQFFMIGVLGEYVGRIYEQVKRRPLYIVSEQIGFKRKRPRAPKNADATQEVALITTSESVVVVGVPESAPVVANPPPPARRQPESEPQYFPKASTQVHTLFGNPAPKAPEPAPAPKAIPAMPKVPTVPTEIGFAAPRTPAAPIPPDATAEIPLVTAKSATPPKVEPAPSSTTERGLGALALLERAARSVPPPRSVPPESTADSTNENEIIGLVPTLDALAVESTETPEEPPAPAAKVESIKPDATAKPGELPPPPAALTAALAEAEAAVTRSSPPKNSPSSPPKNTPSSPPGSPSRPPPARRPSIAEMPNPDAPKPAQLDLSHSVGALPIAAMVEPVTELPPVVETKSPTKPPVPTSGSNRPPLSKSNRPPNVTARLAALKPEATRAVPREAESVPDTAKSAVDETVKPKPRDEES